MSELQKEGVMLRFTFPHTSEQNGVVEYRHRRIVEQGLALPLVMHMPFVYWPFDIRTVANLLNRLPTKILSGLSPYKVLLSTPPDYSQLKVLVCECFPCVRAYIVIN